MMYEFSIDNGQTWHGYSIFDTLKEYTTYVLMIRAVGITGKRYKPSSPACPILRSMSDDYIEVIGISGQEFSIDDGATFQNSGRFDNLTKGEVYKVITRLKESDLYLTGKPSLPLIIKI